MNIEGAGPVSGELSFWDKVKALVGKVGAVVDKYVYTPAEMFRGESFLENSVLGSAVKKVEDVKDNTVQVVSDVKSKLTNVLKLVGVGVVCLGVIKIKGWLKK